ncbi:hypothetical protein SAMN02910275_00654 [Butyrivibrio sp. INlla18]|nr:hypothetical protein SAMN02910275_00654 [Butyrivibrio sp. INlla18]
MFMSVIFLTLNSVFETLSESLMPFFAVKFCFALIKKTILFYVLMQLLF